MRGCGTQRPLPSAQDGGRRMGFPRENLLPSSGSGTDAADIAPEEDRWWALDPRKPCSCAWLGSAPWRQSGPGSSPDTASVSQEAPNSGVHEATHGGY